MTGLPIRPFYYPNKERFQLQNWDKSMFKWCAKITAFYKTYCIGTGVENKWHFNYPSSPSVYLITYGLSKSQCNKYN